MNQVWNLEDKLKYINCKLVNHDQNIILFCLRKDCTKSRLLCKECLPLHVGHNLCDAVEIQEKIDKIHCVQNQSAKKALQLFQEFKTKLLIHVDQIEKYIMDSCQLPNSTLEFNQMRSKLISEEGININEMEQMLNKLINDQQPETVNYRQYASNSILIQYVQQFNRWLQQMPKISQKLEKCVFLKEPNQGFGICYSNKISKSNYLMQPFTSLENSLLSSITIGKANVANPQNEKLNLKIIMGLDLDQVIFEEEFTIQSIKQNIYKWELQFTKPIQLIRENMYSIIATTNQNEEYTICDFKQQEIINPYIRNEIIDCQTFINKPGNVELTMKIFVSDFTLLISNLIQ